MNDITYHRVNPNDFQILVDLRMKFLIEFWGNHPSESIDKLKKHLENYFRESLTNNTCIGYLAKSGDEIAGVGCLAFRDQPGNFKNPSGKVGYILNMYTLQSFRRKGICTAILELLIEEATKTGITTFELLASKEGEYVYKKNGFEIHNQPTYRRYINK